MIAQIQNVLQCAIAHIYVRLQIAEHICMHQAELAALHFQLFRCSLGLILQYVLSMMHFVFCIIFVFSMICTLYFV